MKKIILPFVIVAVCLISDNATRAIGATNSAPAAVLPLGNVRSSCLVQIGNNLLSSPNQLRTLSFAERVKYQRAIEEIYWRHRIWPKDNPNPKPSLDAVVSQTQIEKKVQDYLGKSSTAPEQLQAEMNRMAEHTRQPEMLQELFGALGNDPFIIAECLARPILAQRLVEQSASEQTKQAGRMVSHFVAPTAGYRLPVISGGGCTDDTWSATTTTNAPSARFGHTAVWTGSEMIVWGGFYGDLNNGSPLNTGGRYDPATDSWTATSTTNAPDRRFAHTAVWTGSEMIVWAGTPDFNLSYFLNSGGRYDPVTDSWTGTSMTNAPSARFAHTAVWTGAEMIVWGGEDDNGYLGTGGRYDPSRDIWTGSSTTNAPAAREQHTAVWTGSEMIVWGGFGGSREVNTGGRYDPGTDSWTATSTTGAPTARYYHTAVWTGSQMIVWGGLNDFSTFDTGGRYNPSTDSWIATSASGAPARRLGHTAVWTGSEMIVWGGLDNGTLNTGGRYNPSTDGWIATSTTNAPAARNSQTGLWTGSEMIVWGGLDNSGGRYCASNVSKLGNISTRAFVQTGDNVMIGGFIVQGTDSKRVIIRAIGPELTQYGVPNVLANPILELNNSTGALIASNDSWRHTIIGGIINSGQVRDIRNSGHAPADARESAIIADLQAGNYTAIVRGVNNTMGVGLVEVYDLSPESGSTLGNISSRSFVQTGDDVMIGGFIVQGTQPKRVILRAIGPELSQYGVPNPLTNPTLELHNSTGTLIASNDNWQHTIIGGIIMNDQVRDIRTSGHAPTDGRESAIIAELPPGNYTAIVRGANNTTGVGLVEVYDLD